MTWPTRSRKSIREYIQITGMMLLPFYGAAKLNLLELATGISQTFIDQSL